MSDKSKQQKKIDMYYQRVILKNNDKICYNLFLHTNSLLMYKLNTVKFLNNLLYNVFKSYVMPMPDKSKSLKNE